MINLKKIIEEYEIAIVVDRSYSMTTQDVPVKSGGFFGFGSKTVSRWDAVGTELAAFAKEVEKIDTDGLDLVFFGGTTTAHRNLSSADVMRLFDSAKPNGSTPLHSGLMMAIDVLKGTQKPKKFIIVYTDGSPDDRYAAKDVIVRQANSQSRDDELTILFLQVGNDRSATDYLRMLDDDLKEAKFDIVDAKTADEAKQFGSIAELIAAAIND